jgi:hypothetical protein
MFFLVSRTILRMDTIQTSALKVILLYHWTIRLWAAFSMGEKSAANGPENTICLYILSHKNNYISTIVTKYTGIPI